MNLHEEIEMVAYELYEKSGRVGGRDLENWLEAENFVRVRHAKKELVATAAKQMEQVAGAAAEKVKKAVKRSSNRVKECGKKEDLKIKQEGEAVPKADFPDISFSRVFNKTEKQKKGKGQRGARIA